MAGGQIVVVTINYRLGALGFLAHPALGDGARGGVVGVRVTGERVFLTGQAITIWRGELLV